LTAVKGQLNAARQVFQEAGLESLPLASLRKKMRKFSCRASPNRLFLPKSSVGAEACYSASGMKRTALRDLLRKVHTRRTFNSTLMKYPASGRKKEEGFNQAVRYGAGHPPSDFRRAYGCRGHQPRSSAENQGTL